MDKIVRFDEDGIMYEVEDGTYMLHSDHARVVAEKDAEIARLRGEISESFHAGFNRGVQEGSCDADAVRAEVIERICGALRITQGQVALANISLRGEHECASPSMFLRAVEDAIRNAAKGENDGSDD